VHAGDRVRGFPFLAPEEIAEREGPGWIDLDMRASGGFMAMLFTEHRSFQKIRERMYERQGESDYFPLTQRLIEICQRLSEQHWV
jgi:hypothetical protein